MQALERLEEYLRGRAVELQAKKAEGRKIVGYLPNGYLPEELVLACDAIPVGLARGGEHEAVLTAGAYISRWLDTFCRAQIGYRVLQEDPYYQMVDVYVVPISDNNERAIADGWWYFTDGDVFTYAVPHHKKEHAYKYYLWGINRFKAKLESLTGNKITDGKLKEAITLCNRERELLREISLMRKGGELPITAVDFVKLNHASFVADKKFMVEILESVLAELKKQKPAPVKGPRILLTGSTLAHGDDRIMRLIEEAGGVVVIERFAECLKEYWETVKTDGDPMEALAKALFLERVPPGWFRPGREGLDFLVKLAKDYKVNGVIWYQLMYRDSYDFESYWFPDILKEGTGLSMFKIESDYDAAEAGPFRTRVETYVETIRR